MPYRTATKHDTDFPCQREFAAKHDTEFLCHRELAQNMTLNFHAIENCHNMWYQISMPLKIATKYASLLICVCNMLHAINVIQKVDHACCISEIPSSSSKKKKDKKIHS